MVVSLDPSSTSYYSGRQAVCMSRRGDGTRGLYTLVYDDREGNPLLAYFTASGWACCYHRNGSIHLLSNEEGGCLFDEVSVAMTTNIVSLIDYHVFSCHVYSSSVFHLAITGYI